MTANINLKPGTDDARSTVAEALNRRPGLTARKLAGEENLPLPAVTEALKALEAAGTATRTPGPTNGNRKSADVWHPATDATGDGTAPTADTTPTDATGTADSHDEATAPTADTTTADEANAPTADTTPAPVAEPDTDEAPAATDEPATPAPVSADKPTPDVAAPVPAAPVTPRKADLKVMLMAGVLGDHPDGVSAGDAIAESGLAVGVADTILAAMEVAGAAVRRIADDGAETWVLGEADLATVDPANAPTHVTCHACGHTRRIRRASAAAPRRNGTGRVAPEANSDGSERLMKNGLRNRVEAFMRDLGPGHQVTPGTVARELGRSSGAVGNAMEKLEQSDVLMLVNEAPVTYELSPDAPAPAAPVAGLMTAPAAPDAPATGDTATTEPADTATTTATTAAPTSGATGEPITA